MAEQQGFFGSAGRVVEELETDDDDTDTQGANLISGTARFFSDSYHSTGRDRGARGAKSSRRIAYGPSDEEDSSDGQSSQVVLKDKDDALIQSANQRIRRAQEKGKKEVKLSKDELAAWERRQRKIKEEEARKAARKASGSASGSDRRKRKEKEQRIAVPLTRLEPTSRKKRSPLGDDVLPRHPSPSTAQEPHARPGYPPMGYFPPPTTRTRPRSGTSSSRPSSRSSRPPSRSKENRPPSPLPYEYPQASTSSRRVSEMPRSRHRSSFDAQAYEESRVSPASSNSPREGHRSMDPFQYQTAGPRAPHQAGAAAAQRRYVSGPPDMHYAHLRQAELAPAAARGGTRMRYGTPPDEETSGELSSEEESEDSEDESESDERHHGARIRETVSRVRGSDVVVQEPDPKPPKSKKSSSPVKRKPIPGNGKKKR